MAVVINHSTAFQFSESSITCFILFTGRSIFQLIRVQTNIFFIFAANITEIFLDFFASALISQMDSACTCPISFYFSQTCSHSFISSNGIMQLARLLTSTTTNTTTLYIFTVIKRWQLYDSRTCCSRLLCREGIHVVFITKLPKTFYYVGSQLYPETINHVFISGSKAYN